MEDFRAMAARAMSLVAHAFKLCLLRLVCAFRYRVAGFGYACQEAGRLIFYGSGVRAIRNILNIDVRFYYNDADIRKHSRALL